MRVQGVPRNGWVAVMTRRDSIKAVVAVGVLFALIALGQLQEALDPGAAVFF